MAARLRRILTASYAVTIILGCLFLSALTVGYAWSERNHSRTNVVISTLFAGFFLYAAVVLLFQSIQGRQYQVALHALGFMPFDWKQVPIQQVVASVFAHGRKAFLSRGFQGQVDSQDVYVFDFESDTAWWSKRGTAVVVSVSGNFPIDRARQLLLDRADAELVIDPKWLVVCSRHPVSPKAFGQWVITVVETLQRG
jgi:hypothetical protein